MMIRPARHSEHRAVLALAKTSKYTRDFGNMMFSSEDAYNKGWIVVAEPFMGAQRIFPEVPRPWGFYCVRHKVREPATSLYFITVHPDVRFSNLKIGTKLLQHMVRTTPHRRIQLNVMKDNDSAIKFYLRHGFVIAGDGLRGQAHRMVREW